MAAIGQAARCVDGHSCLDRAPAADRVEFLERQAGRVHQVVARGAGLVRAVLGQPLANGEIAVHRVVLQRRNVGQRRRGRDAQKIPEDPLAAKHRRGPGGVGRDHQNARLAEQAAAPAVVIERHATEAAAVDVRDAVMLREPFVDERVVGAQEIERASILAQDALEKELGLLPEGLPEIVVEVRKQPHVRRDRRKIPQLQPLRCEVGHQGSRTLVGEHPPHLPLERRRLMERFGRREVQQLVVWNAAPEEERQPGRQLQIADAIGGVRCEAGRILFDAKQELRAHQDGGERHFDARFEAVLRARFLVQRERTLQVGARHRAPVRASHQRGKDAPRRVVFLGRTRRARHENPAAAGRLAGACRRIGPDDGNRVDGGLEPWMPVRIEARLVGLTRRFDERRRLFQKRHAERMRAGRHRHANLEMLVDRVVGRFGIIRRS